MSQEYYQRKWRVESQTKPDKYYTVSQRNDGAFECSCPDWIYRRHQCKHIRGIVANMHEIENERRERRRDEPARAVHVEDMVVTEVNGRVAGLVVDF